MQVRDSGIMERILAWARFKESSELKKITGGKRSALVSVPKLDDANMAGGPHSKKCTLILTEGDSAKALAISGLSVVGRDYFGVFPLKGKLLNVREASHSQMMANSVSDLVPPPPPSRCAVLAEACGVHRCPQEIQNLVTILGLKFGQEYTSADTLRYGHIMIMADQDHDGSHIKGLVINFLHNFWPSLLRVPGFVQEFVTPIVKCVSKSRTLSFYTMPEYITWMVRALSLAGCACARGVTLLVSPAAK